MLVRIVEFHIKCERCSAVMDLSTVVSKPDGAIARQTLNELLVDYGWLPTAEGTYCRQHAAPARENRPPQP
jgi:hypothetical protein